MNRRNFLHTAVCAAPAVALLAKPAAAQLAGGVDELVREAGFTLEIPVTKAVAGTGALLHIARETLPALEFAEVTKFLPGAERLIFQAANVVAGALPKSLQGMGAVMEKVQLPVEASEELRAFILDYLGRNGGRKVVALLRKAWRG